MNNFFPIYRLTFGCLLYVTILALSPHAPAQYIGQMAKQDHPIRILSTPVDFAGPTESDLRASTLTAIKIGFFMPDEPRARLIKAAELAVSEINDSGGYRGIPLKLVSRWASDPWGSGSKEIIKLIYQDSVWAIIGSIDGKATHIAEQIVTKSWLPLLSPVSSDPTLNYINIPWMFRLPPDYNLQAITITEQGICNGSLTRIGLITSIDHDGRTFSEDMMDALSEKKITPLFHFEVPMARTAMDELIEKMTVFYPDALILHLAPEDILSLFSELSKREINLTCLLPWIPGLDIESLSEINSVHFCYIEPFATGKSETYNLFAEKYFHKFRQHPAAEDAYTYDAVYIVAGALNQSGLNRVKLRKAIANLSDMAGVTGKINWDNGGGNTARPVLHRSKMIKN